LTRALGGNRSSRFAAAHNNKSAHRIGNRLTSKRSARKFLL